MQDAFSYALLLAECMTLANSFPYWSPDVKGLNVANSATQFPPSTRESYPCLITTQIACGIPCAI